MSATLERTVGAGLDRVEGREKVAGEAKYAYEYDVDGVAYAVAVPSTVARGEVRGVNADEVLRLPGVLAVLWHGNAPALHEVESAELQVLQSPRVAYRRQWVAAVVADTFEAAQEAARVLRIEYDAEEHHVVLREDDPGLYTPSKVNPNFPSDTHEGDFDAAFAEAPVSVDRTYRTPTEHNHPMEPHATLAVWDGDGGLTLYDSNQGVRPVRETLAKAFGLDPAKVRVVAPHVGGGFGSKGTPRPNVVLAAMAAQVVGRPTKLAVTRQQMFAVTGYRTPTIQRLRLGAERDGTLTAIAHDVIEQSSTLTEFAEQTAVLTRMLYAAPNRRTTHLLTRLDVPTPSWMRAPGECPGSFALESAMDELARELDLDPIELRIRNEPELDPESGNRFSSRNAVACLREGSERFGWRHRAAPRRAPALRHRCRSLDLPGASHGISGDRARGARRLVRRPHRRRRHRHRCADRTDTDRRRDARRRARARDRRDRRLALAAGDDRGRVDGAHLVGLRGRQGVQAAGERDSATGSRRTGSSAVSTRRRTSRRSSASRSRDTRSGRSSSRCASTSTPARSVSRVRPVSSPAAGSSTRRPRAPNSSAG